ncbi:RNA polymerase sigma factor SigJ [Embleya sp. NPDC059237]|uniref:RNA polymerase sigma factor SigJ n=1 Tax=Embleya sp. NPDC059237 TaxID=3346784 RepID=UPI0036792269
MRATDGDTMYESGVEAVMEERQRLINLAYRLLGSLADAEDVVQETYARWYSMTDAQRDEIEVPAAWLTKVAGRVCLTLLGSARARRETYVGEWLPEPLPEPTEWITGGAAGGGMDPADRITLDESVSMAFLVVFESMTPAERVAFVLHDIFRYPFTEVATIVGRTPAACRQLASSARRRIRESRVDADPSAGHAAVVRDFKAAWDAKNIGALIGLLDPNATWIADGGGKAVTILDPIIGGERIAHTYLQLATVAPDYTLLERTVNGLPGLVVQQNGRAVTVFAFHVVGERIHHIWTVRNPDKLRPWTTR